MKLKLKAVQTPLKLDLGSGKNTREGFDGVDSRDFGQKYIIDLRKPWPWDDESVEEVHCSHFLEHFTAPERIHFVNELYRVLQSPVNAKPGAAFAERLAGKAQIITPHWASNRAYGDLTHQWPPVSEMWFYYLDKNWRETNAPHNDFYKCDFLATWGYSLNPSIVPRNQEYQQHALQFWKEAAQDIIATLVKR
jgi:hypothetical protein